MRLYLAASSHSNQVNHGGGVPAIGEFMKLYLATSPQAGATVAIRQVNLYLERFNGRYSRERERDVQLRILLSYWYYKDVDLDALFAKYFTAPYPDVFADSGAFSAMSQKVEVNIDDYAAWLKRYKHLFSTYSNLDVIGNAEATLKNQTILEDRHGLEPRPVVHAANNYDPLEYYLSKGYKYIALGGLVPYAAQPKLRMRYLIKAFQMAKGQAVFHGFGVTSWEVMSQLPWYSVDSSSWGSGFRFGTVPLFDSRIGKFQKAKLGNAPKCIKHMKLFETLGFDWQDFADRKRNDRAKICAISALSYIKAEQFLRRKFGEIHIPGSNESEVLRTHLADANPASGLHLAERDPQHHSWVDAGVKVHIAAGAKSENSNSGNPAIAESGIKVHLADAPNNGGGGDVGLAVTQFKKMENIK